MVLLSEFQHLIQFGVGEPVVLVGKFQAISTSSSSRSGYSTSTSSTDQSLNLLSQAIFELNLNS